MLSVTAGTANGGGALPLEEVADRATITGEEAAALLGIGRLAAYEAARLGQLPTRRLGRRLIVPVPAFLAWLGPQQAAPDGSVDRQAPPTQTGDERPPTLRGHIHKRTKHGADGKPKTYWYVVVDIGVDETGKRRQKWHGSYKTRREAERASVTILRDLDDRTYVEPRKLTLAEYVRNDWLPLMRQQVKASTWNSYDRNLELHVLPWQPAAPGPHARPLNALYRQLLENGRRNGPAGRGLSAKTVRYIHTTVSKVLNDAVDQELLQRNPAARAKPPRPPRGAASMQFWTPEELRRFLGHARTHRWFPLWRLAAMTGMRRGELMGLRWKDIDFAHSRLAMRQTLISISYRTVLSTPKTHRARVNDLDDETLGVLCGLYAERGHPPADALVFDDGEGRPIHPESVRVVFERLHPHAGVPRIRCHDLRHTHATIAVRAGVPVKVISERIGHATPAFTLQQYAHVIPGMQAEAAQQVADLVGGPDDEQDGS